jgi:tetratricopeptide (TPR) repeat protein
VSSHDWYTNTSWNEEIERVFFEKLARAKSQRDQYLAIQAWTLASFDPDVALRLADHYFETRRDDFHDTRALNARADAYRTLGNVPDTVRAYKEILALEEEAPNPKTNSYVDFPYFVASESLTDEFDFALGVLEKRKADLRLPINRFLWHAAYALIQDHREEHALASEHARQALDASEVEDSGFRYLMNIGLVGDEHQPLKEKLAVLAS